MSNEAELIERTKNGDKTAFRELVEQNKRNVYYLAFDLTNNKEDAEDISQEVFVKVFRSLHKFRGDSKFSTWIYRITVNTCYSLRNKKSYSEMTTKENIDEIVDSSETKIVHAFANPERITDSGIIQDRVEMAMEKLSKKEKAVFVLRNYRELTFDEIVDVMKIKSSTVRSLNFRALKKMRKELAFLNPSN